MQTALEVLFTCIWEIFINDAWFLLRHFVFVLILHAYGKKAVLQKNQNLKSYTFRDLSSCIVRFDVVGRNQWKNCDGLGFSSLFYFDF